MRRTTYTLALVSVALSAPPESQAQAIKVTLLGTGTPEPSIERFGPATPEAATSQAAQRIIRSHSSPEEAVRISRESSRSWRFIRMSRGWQDPSAGRHFSGRLLPAPERYTLDQSRSEKIS